MANLQNDVSLLPDRGQVTATTSIQLQHALFLPEFHLTIEFFTLLTRFSFRMRYVKYFNDGLLKKREDTELFVAKSLGTHQIPVILVGDLELEPSMETLDHKAAQEQKFALGIVNLIIPLRDKPCRYHPWYALNRHFSLLSRYERYYQLHLFLDQPSHRYVIDHFLDSLPLSNATALNLFIYNNKELKSYCAHCQTKWNVVLRSGLHYDDFYRHHKNFHGYILFVVGLKKSVKCRAGSRSSLTYIRRCALEELQTKLNYSTYYFMYKQGDQKKLIRKTLGVVHGGYVSEEAYEKMETDQALVWMITAELFSSCRILSVFHIRRTELYTAAIKALDEVSWVCLKSSACLTALILAFILNPEGGQTWRILSRTVACVIDQGGLFNPKNWSWQARLVLLVWLLSLIVIVAGYKGVLVSLLTKPSRVVAPSSLQELAGVKMPIYTLEEYFPSRKNRSSLLHHVMDEILSKESNRKEEAFGNTPFSQLLTRLKPKLKFASAIGVGEFASQRLFGALVMIRGNESHSQVANGVLDTYQGDHVLLSNEIRIKTYFQLVLVSGKRTGIQVSPELHAFIQRHPTLVERNFFAKVLTDGMLQLVESGCWQRWEEEHRHAVTLREFNTLHDYSLYENVSLPTLGNPSAVYFTKTLTIQGFTCTKDEYEDLSLENLRGPFLFLMYSLVAVILMWVLEKVVHERKVICNYLRTA